MPTKEKILKDIAEVINRYSMERLYGANVPDFILAEVALDAIHTFTKNFKAGCDWYSVCLEPGNTRFKEADK